jgi:hypothetical protein
MDKVGENARRPADLLDLRMAGECPPEAQD